MKIIKTLVGVVLLIPFALLDSLLLVIVVLSLFSEGGGSSGDESQVYGLTRWLLRKMGWMKQGQACGKSTLTVSSTTASDETEEQRKPGASWIGHVVRVAVWTGVAILLTAFIVLVGCN